jgi:hypothetical protein
VSIEPARQAGKRNIKTNTLVTTKMSRAMTDHYKDKCVFNDASDQVLDCD